MSGVTKISVVQGTGIVHRGNEVDTDAIIPARYMTEITFARMGEYVFGNERFDEAGQARPHNFSDPRFKGASILFVNKNFGCGSSREHAPQALVRWGIKAICGESFAKIFAGNCGALGIPAVTLTGNVVAELMDLVDKDPASAFTLDLESKTLSRAGGKSYGVDLPDAARSALLSGAWDTTGMLVANREKVAAVAARLPYVDGWAFKG